MDAAARLQGVRLVRLLAALLLTCWVAAPAAASTAMLKGLKIHYTVQGKPGGKTLIFVHGWTCDDRSWSRQVPAFVADYRVVTLDLPGHGQSDSPPPAGYSIGLFADAVEAVRKAVGANKVVLVGHSMGAGVSRLYTLAHPEHVAGIVSADGLLDIRPFAAAALRAQPMTHERRVAAIEAMFVPSTPEPLRQEIRQMMLGASEATSVGANAAMMDPAIQSNAVITAPALTVFASSRTMGLATPTKELLPNWESVTIPDTGHFVMMEKPDQFNALLHAFLATRARWQ
ncbi:alpha/beta fold hydrolase [Sphingobium nicotianae]|uniref:Alpha/beta hydrolase n=1 Tax=Sphingobium nicotianae TaxID=2782607 RepID=A0A9X1DCK5_9SPHN|nr:alpha/beta hydrolase [Sphingobium nicotianae]MBT2187370.1 alpha/beta hydrolase [Sphingobium nicotianae]